MKPTVYLGDLDGPDGNAFAVLAKCKTAAKNEKMSNDLYAQFRKEAMSADYDNLLETVRKYFNAKVLESVRTRKL